MRIELALIVGILFFCSWCAYIIIKMNSSVSVSSPTPTPSTLLQPANETYLSSGSQHHLYRNQFSGVGGLPNNQLPPPQYTRQHHHHYEANSPAAYFARNAYSSRLQPPAQQHDSRQQAPYAGATWRAAPTTSASTWRDYSSVLARPAAAASWQPQSPRHTPASYAYPTASQWRPSAPPVAARPQEQTGNPSEPDNDPEPDPDEQPAADSDNDDNGSDNDDSSAGSSAAATNEQPQNREFEEEVGRRTYSEDEADANERDRDGNLLVTHRKHLINGRPVVGASSSSGATAAAADNESDEGDASAASAPDEPEEDGGRAKRRRRHRNGDAKTAAKADRDFESIASEIDADNQRSTAANTVDYDETAGGSSTAPGASSAASKVRARNGPKRQQLSSSTIDRQPQAVESRQRQVVRAPNSGASQGLLDLVGPLVGKQVVAAPAAPQLIRSNIGSAKSTTTTLMKPDEPPTGRNHHQSKATLQSSKVKPKESHEHRLRESLREQHWDDDASSNPTGTVANTAASQRNQTDAPAKVDESLDDEEDEEAEAPPVEQADAPEPEEPQQVDSALSELDMLVDPDKFMADENSGGVGGQGQRRRKKRQTDLISGNSTTSDSNEFQPDGQSTGNSTTAPNPKETSESLSGAEEVNVDVIEPPPPPPAHYDYREGVSQLPPPQPPPEAYERSPLEQQPLTPEQQPSEQQQPPLPHIEDPYGSFYNDQPPPPLPPVSHNGHSNGHAPSQPELSGQPSVAPDYYGAPLQYPEAPNSNQNQLVGAPQPEVGQVGGPSNFAYVYPPLTASGSKSSKKKVKKTAKKKKFRRSKMEENKRKAAKTAQVKKKSKSKKGGRNRKKKKAKKKFAHSYKEFEGVKKGQKKSKGDGDKGAKKGALYYKDKGYKKRGFKKVYSKSESGDHKMYFDEFRDKDHNKKWKNFKDNQHYSQHKNWKGKDKKKYMNHHLKELKDRKYGVWRDKAAQKYRKESKQHRDSAYSKRKRLKFKQKKKKMKKKSSSSKDKFA